MVNVRVFVFGFGCVEESSREGGWGKDICGKIKVESFVF